VGSEKGKRSWVWEKRGGKKGGGKVPLKKEKPPVEKVVGTMGGGGENIVTEGMKASKETVLGEKEGKGGQY